MNADRCRVDFEIDTATTFTSLPMDVTQPTASGDRVRITSGVLEDGFGVRVITYEQGDSLLEHKKRRVEIGSTSKTTSAERNQKSR
jgi:hypothetical protein